MCFSLAKEDIARDALVFRASSLVLSFLRFGFVKKLSPDPAIP
jgi:hypothetical protein